METMPAPSSAQLLAKSGCLRASVCVCTHNGGRRLASIFECLAVQTAPVAEWEVLIIDNASTDDTPAVAAALFERCALQGCVVLEPQPGLSFARRRAAMKARGEIVCFLDDDNLPDRDYVEQALRSFAEHPEAGSIGGKVLADWETEPTVLVRAVEGFALAIVDRGDEPFVYDWIADGPVGAGLCIRRDLLLQALNDPKVCASVTDRRGASLVSGGDMALAVMVRQAGYERRYEPALRLRHRLAAERMTREYLLRLYEGIGRGQAGVRRLWARGGNRRAVSLLVAAKDFFMWLSGRILGPRNRRLTPVPCEGSLVLRRDLHALEQSLLWGRAADALEFAFAKLKQNV